MNTKNSWEKLSRAARQQPKIGSSVPRDRASAQAEMPWGFETRVLAQLRSNRSVPAGLWLRLAARVLPVAAAVFLVCLFAFQPAQPAPSGQDSAELADLLIVEALPQ